MSSKNDEYIVIFKFKCNYPPQDSLAYDICLTAADGRGIATVGGYGLPGREPYCIRVRVARCRCCSPAPFPQLLSLTLSPSPLFFSHQPRV